MKQCIYRLLWLSPMDISMCVLYRCLVSVTLIVVPFATIGAQNTDLYPIYFPGSAYGEPLVDKYCDGTPGLDRQFDADILGDRIWKGMLLNIKQIVYVERNKHAKSQIIENAVDAVSRAVAAQDSIGYASAIRELHRQNSTLWDMYRENLTPEQQAMFDANRARVEAELLERDSVIPSVEQYDKRLEREKQAEVARDISPRYPDVDVEPARRGKVHIVFVVDSLGKVESRNVLIMSSTSKHFTSAVCKAMPGMKFLPAMIGNRKKSQLVQRTVTFADEGRKAF